MKKIDIGDVRGLDTFNSINNVSLKRAVELTNFICDNGINHKRDGVLERATLPIGSKINGLWQYSSNIYIAHCGNKLYRLNLGANTLSTKITELHCAGLTILDLPSWGIVDGDKLYVLCGDYLIYYFDSASNADHLERVLNNYEHTYIPTTTISIDSEGAAEKIRSDFEKPNLLTKWRINNLQPMPESTADTDANKTYYLDASMESGTLVTIECKRIVGGAMTTETYQNKNGVGYDGILRNGSTKVGTVEFGIGKIVFDTVVKSNKAKEDSIKVTFACSEGVQSERVTGCRFGTQFGLYGNNDRLFLAGNIAYPNMDFYSESNDYTYFADENYTVFGGSQSIITGYSRINDGSLGVHKGEGDTSGIYYRTSSVENARDAVSGATVTETVFPVKAGALGQYCVSDRTCKRLDNDTLFLSQSGVYCVAIGDSVATNERYARERSQNISNDIKKLSLREPNAVVYGGRYYLFLGNYCYIADSRYKYGDKNMNGDTFNYEWWRYELPLDVTTAIVASGGIILGSRDGRIFSFNETKKDVSYKIYGTGKITLNKGASHTLDNTTAESLFINSNIARIIIYGDGVSIKYDSGGGTTMELANGECLIVKNTASGLDTYELHRFGYNVNTPQNTLIQITNSIGTIYLAEVIALPIKLLYKSPMMDMGSGEYYKELRGVGVNCSGDAVNSFNVKLESRSNAKSIEIQEEARFDFNSINFGLFSFGTGVFTKSNIRPLRIRNVNYLQLIVESENDYECNIDNISISYDMGIKIARGVK